MGKINITVFMGDQRNVTAGEVREYQSLEHMSRDFRTPIKGPKHCGYFVRGSLSPMHRKDSNLKTSKLIVIDGDMGKDGGNCCDPLVLHQHLIELGYNHFIYTSHSHEGRTKNKFRAVLETDEMVRDQLIPTLRGLAQELDGCNLKFVKEMNVWSQPWFLPARSDPEDGLFEYYGWFEGKEVPIGLIPACVVSEGTLNNGPKESLSLKEHYWNIITGKTYHQSLLALTYGWACDGLIEHSIVANARAVMNLSKDFQGKALDQDRWSSRYDDIPRYAKDALKKANNKNKIDISDIILKEDSAGLKIPWPPGLLGELAEDAYNMAHYQYNEVAVVSAIGLVAALAGRKFNVSETGLNVYMTLIMRTGMGKDFIGKWISRIICSLNPINSAGSSFIGSSNHTGPKSIAKDLENARSQICLMTEAGFLLQSKVGDSGGKCRYLLSLYGCSGQNDIIQAESYSKDEEKMPAIRAPALSVINEATPETLLQAFRDRNSIDTGELPRQSLFRVSDKKPYQNLNARKYSVRPQCLAKLKHIHLKAAEVQARPEPNAHEMLPASLELEHDWQAFSNEMTDIYNNDTDHSRRTMASRAYLKALKFAAIASVMNNKDAIIDWPEWEWGKAMIRYELATLEAFFAGNGAGNPLHDLAMHVVGPYIVKILRHQLKSPKCQATATDRSGGMFPKFALAQATRTNQQLAAINDNPALKSHPLDGLTKVLNYMVNEHYLIEVGEIKSISDKRTSYKYVITELFKTLFMND